MPKVYAPNKHYTGISASVPFVDGVGETDNEYLLEWFEKSGYQIEEKDADPEPASENEPKTLEEMSATELRDLAKQLGIKGTSSMNKDELKEALDALEGDE